jgi:hypothetical protein
VISSEVSIYNLALNAIGARSNVSSPDERSREAEVCKLWYSPVRDQVLAASVWPEATKLAYLALLDERDQDVAWVSTNARPDYQFAYSTPSDMLHPQYLSSYQRFLVTAYPGNTKAIVTNVESAILIYTSRLETISLWSASLQMAIVYGLASHIAMPLSGKQGRTKQLADKANELIWAARERAANTSNEQMESIPDWIAGRGYISNSPAQRYVYPYGDAFGSNAVAV